MYNLETFKAKAAKIHNNKYDYSKAEFLTTKKPVTMICPHHGEFRQTPDGHFAGKGCRQCAWEINGKNLALSEEDFISRCKALFPGKYTYSKVQYVSHNRKVAVNCRVHGEFFASAGNLLAGHGCKSCGILIAKTSRQSLTTKEFIRQANIMHKGKFNYSKTVYTGKLNSMLITCPVHGDFSQEARSHLKGWGCAKCSYTARGLGKRLTTAEFISRANDVHGGRYDYMHSIYIKAKFKLKIICKVHGEFLQDPDHHLSGRGCAKCALSESRPEEELKTAVRAMYSGKLLENHRKLIRSNKGTALEVDLYLPCINLAIEMNGVYYHSEKFGKSNKYHKHKTDQCATEGVQLIHIFDDDWKFRQEAVLNMLTAKLGVADRTYARKCTIQEEPTGVVRGFMEGRHIQGCGKGLNITLRYEESIVAVCTFSKQLSHRGKITEGAWELSRYASKGLVVGGLSKCLTYFIRNYFPGEIISYSDNCISNGAVYEKLGFSFVADLAPDYKYLEGEIRVHKANFTKNKLKVRLPNFNPQETEKENCKRYDYYRIWDCGKKKWSMQL